MYVGHFAIGLALKARFPDVPAVPLLMGAGFLDVLDGLFIVLGWNHVVPDLSAGPYLFFDLRFIDWDHSLAAALCWSVLWALCFIRDRRVAGLAFVASFSHFLADWPVHNHDLALYPHADLHLGYGLWGKLGTLSWGLEGVFAATLVAYAWSVQARRGIRMGWPCGLLAVLFVGLSPWLSPMRFIATLPEPWTHLWHGAFVAVGFLVPGMLLCRWLQHSGQRAARSVPSAAGSPR